MSDEWLYEQLSDLLQFPVPQEMIDYIKSIVNMRDLEDYIRTLLDFDNPQHKRFLQELIQRRKGSGVGYKKNEIEEDFFAPKVEKKKKDKGNKSQPASATSKKGVADQPAQAKKKKFVNLYSQEGQNRDVVLLKGRHKCDCQASKHKLINNCLKCGRIVCEQEGSGPCLFCGNLVCSREEQEYLSSGSKQSAHFLQKLMDQKPAGHDAAIEQRNRLLEYDRNSEKRTRVIDDESDYFCVNSVWLSTAERERLKKKEEEYHARKHQSRRDQKMTLDIGRSSSARNIVQQIEIACLGETAADELSPLRRMIESKPDEMDLAEMDEVLRDISNSINTADQGFYDSENYDPSIPMQPRYDEDVIYELERGKRGMHHETDTITKIQDKEYLEMVDDGLCMSLHQPWASLLVCGIKEHEGRNWYTSHRGRLWIASAAKPPTDQEIQDTESLYRSVKGVQAFPLTYPTGCLLGSVNVVDCLPQEEYQRKFPLGESQSPFVFICNSPQELPIRFPISGKHKIYKLDPGIHQAAQKAMKRLAMIKSEKNSQSFLRNS
ncbi:activating signal cointegrator 1 isoform X1 [Homalodisca vitripennis]|uniref:activating signal cointegrator 1 isoform X1 n=1 Tax=Homalodisca vitripennis TaxID=197043 RepID=UPI001EEA637C|nr:activating signal cointegrator 1 isoform X1 [Homalodisca vitripennis]XP_046661440.1 activating signal cointegrator 1 isoform X1 [Homalodisca vitripennis]XP_046661441.1 activating signal cointegrator 1 isoform X1 [Homalodisca vitripennis]